MSEIRDCDHCAAHLPLGPRPVVQAAPQAKLLIIGQAPGTKVHETGIPWNDASGNRLRDWLQMDEQDFYNPDILAIMPMGFCYPGRFARGGDLPPRKECAPMWHDALLEQLPHIRLTLLIGAYAQDRYLDGKDKMTERVRQFRRYMHQNEPGMRYLPLPHPSWRNTAWMKKHPWFEDEVLPLLRAEVEQCING